MFVSTIRQPSINVMPFLRFLLFASLLVGSLQVSNCATEAEGSTDTTLTKPAGRYDDNIGNDD